MALPRQKGFRGGQPRGLMDRVVWRPIGELREFPGNPRRHPEAQIAALMKSIRRFWTNPIRSMRPAPSSRVTDGGRQPSAWA
jgi:hypothetical protein